MNSVIKDAGKYPSELTTARFHMTVVVHSICSTFRLLQSAKPEDDGD